MAWLSMDRLCEEFEAPVPSPAGGSAAAAAAAIAASLVVMVGRGSPDWPEGSSAAASAAALRDRLVTLGHEDVEAIADLIAALGARSHPEPGAEQVDLDRAQLRASRVPLEIAQLAADVAELAAEAGQKGKRPMHAEAGAAETLATAGAQIASSIVTGNLAALPPDYPGEEVARLREAAHQAAMRVGTSLRPLAPSGRPVPRAEASEQPRDDHTRTRRALKQLWEEQDEGRPAE